MKAVHLRLQGLYDDYEEAIVEMLVRLIDGVRDVASIRSLHLVSVLYDEQVASVAQILSYIGRAGFSARVLAPVSGGAISSVAR